MTTASDPERERLETLEAEMRRHDPGDETFRVGRHDVPISPRLSPKVAAGPSPGRGTGLFATETIAAGEIVLVWGGRTYGGAEAAAAARAAGRNTMPWDDDLFSCEGDDHSAFAVNHSCDPNLWMEGTFRLAARRDIAAGEELAMDYAMLGGEEGWRSEWVCRCGALDCRERLTGEDWKDEALRRRYAGHFLPFVNRRIAAEGAGDA